MLGSKEEKNFKVVKAAAGRELHQNMMPPVPLYVEASYSSPTASDCS